MTFNAQARLKEVKRFPDYFRLSSGIKLQVDLDQYIKSKEG